MFTIQFEWKPFRTHIGDLTKEIKALADKCCGCSAHRILEIHFTEEPSEDDKLLVQTLWDELDEVQEAAKFKRDSDREFAKSKAREAIFNLTWDEMIVAERKVMQDESKLTDADLDALVAKYGVQNA